MGGSDDAACDGIIRLEAGRRVVVAGPGSGTQPIACRLVQVLTHGVALRQTLTLGFNRVAVAEPSKKVARVDGRNTEATAMPHR